MSHYPWIISVGQDTCSIVDKLSKRSLTRREGKEPRRDFTAFLREVKGEMRTRAGLSGYLEARVQAGPDPIDLPIRIMSLSLYFSTLTRYWNTS